MKEYTCVGCGTIIQTDDPEEIDIMDLWDFVCDDSCLQKLQEEEKDV